MTLKAWDKISHFQFTFTILKYVSSPLHPYGAQSFDVMLHIACLPSFLFGGIKNAELII